MNYKIKIDNDYNNFRATFESSEKIFLNTKNVIEDYLKI